MSLEDAIGSGPDFTADSVLDRVSRSVLPDLPDNVSADLVLNRLNRKLTLARSGDEKAPEKSETAPEKNGKFDFSSYGTPVGDLPDLSQYGTPADEEVPLPQPRPSGAPPRPTVLQSIHQAIDPLTAAKGVVHGAIEGTGAVVKGLGDIGQAAQNNPDIQAAAAGGDLSNQFGDALGSEALAKQQVLEGRVAAEAKEGNSFQTAGKAITGAADTIAPMTDQEKGSVLGRVATGAGSIAPYALTTLVAGPLPGLAAGFAGMGASTFGSTYDAAKAAGKSEEEASKIASEAGAVSGLLGSLPLSVGKFVKPLIGKIAASGVTFSSLGELQEAVLQEIEKQYDPKAGYSFDAKRAIAALILGGAMGGLHHAAEDRATDQA
jgi:hypothetical protein